MSPSDFLPLHKLLELQYPNEQQPVRQSEFKLQV
jgi:hypothetical protein